MVIEGMGTRLFPCGDSVLRLLSTPHTVTKGPRETLCSTPTPTGDPIMYAPGIGIPEDSDMHPAMRTTDWLSPVCVEWSPHLPWMLASLSCHVWGPLKPGP